MNDFIIIPRSVLREALERIEGDKPGNDSFREHLRSLVRGQSAEAPAEAIPSPA
jgi:hypothetical protein